tara:strand:+ start:5532 stop:6836 length:1305 start_codon:yes stop_codon:yes gene_type:complete
MIQPYFKPDVNPNLPAFAVFYNDFYKERSAMNMQLMKIALEQANPEYLNRMIDRTQGNIEDLRKLKANIMESEARSASKAANDFMRYQMQAQNKNADLNFKKQKELFDVITGDMTSSAKSKSDLKRYEKVKSTAIANLNKAEELEDPLPKDTEELNRWASRNNLDTEKLSILIKEGKITDENTITDIRTEYLQGISDFEKGYIETQYPNLVNNIKESEEIKTESLEELGFMLSPEEKAEANKYIKMVGGQPQLRKNVPEDKKEMVEREMKNRISTKKIGVGMPRGSGASSNFQNELNKIDAELQVEAKKLQGLYTRYGVQQQQGIDRIFDPFESNYRTENLFQRKSPRVQRVEQQISDYQYRDIPETPIGYENIEYNKEYQAPGGLYFGLTKVGDQDTPYIFEDGVPFEITTGEPEYNTIIELLKEQDKKIGGL